MYSYSFYFHHHFGSCIPDKTKGCVKKLSIAFFLPISLYLLLEICHQEVIWNLTTSIKFHHGTFFFLITKPETSSILYKSSKNLLALHQALDIFPELNIILQLSSNQTLYGFSKTFLLWLSILNVFQHFLKLCHLHRICLDSTLSQIIIPADKKIKCIPFRHILLPIVLNPF